MWKNRIVLVSKEDCEGDLLYFLVQVSKRIKAVNIKGKKMIVRGDKIRMTRKIIDALLLQLYLSPETENVNLIEKILKSYYIDALPGNGYGVVVCDGFIEYEDMPDTIIKFNKQTVEPRIFEKFKSSEWVRL